MNQKQIEAQKRLGLPVIVYAPQATLDQKTDIRRFGAIPITDFNLLVQVLDRIRTEVDSKVRFH